MPLLVWIEQDFLTSSAQISLVSMQYIWVHVKWKMVKKHNLMRFLESNWVERGFLCLWLVGVRCLHTVFNGANNIFPETQYTFYNSTNWNNAFHRLRDHLALTQAAGSTHGTRTFAQQWRYALILIANISTSLWLALIFSLQSINLICHPYFPNDFLTRHSGQWVYADLHGLFYTKPNYLQQFHNPLCLAHSAIYHSWCILNMTVPNSTTSPGSKHQIANTLRKIYPIGPLLSTSHSNWTHAR